MAVTFRNTVLSHIDAASVARLKLRRIDLPVLYDLEVPGRTIESLVFLEEGIGSMTTAFATGAQVETSMFGYESVIGVSALMGARHSLNRIFMQLSGYGYLSPVSAARAEFERGDLFQQLALRYVQIQLTLSMQGAACNAAHGYVQRLARWLLICSDRAQKDEMELSQDFLAEMIGSTRPSVSLAARNLKALGLIDYQRGTIRLLKKKELEAEACECYRVVRQHLESYANFDPGFTE